MPNKYKTTQDITVNVHHLRYWKQRNGKPMECCRCGKRINLGDKVRRKTSNGKNRPKVWCWDCVKIVWMDLEDE